MKIIYQLSHFITVFIKFSSIAEILAKEHCRASSVLILPELAAPCMVELAKLFLPDEEPGQRKAEDDFGCSCADVR